MPLKSSSKSLAARCSCWLLSHRYFLPSIVAWNSLHCSGFQVSLLPINFAANSSPTNTGLLASSSSRLKMTKQAASVVDAPYGTWKSPITSQAITAGSVGISSLSLLSTSKNKDEELFWLEARPHEGGRSVVCRYKQEDVDSKNSNTVEELTPKDSNVRTRVHEYGGAAYGFIGVNDDASLVFSEFASQRLCRMQLEGRDEGAKSSMFLTPETEEAATFRFADGNYDSRTDAWYAIREDHSKNNNNENASSKNVVNEIITIGDCGTIQDADNNGVRVLVTGNDFFSAPRVSPDGTKLVYVTWKHPNMPWDATELRVVDLNTKDGSPHYEDHLLVDGMDQDTSILQPLWHEPTGDLYYISDSSGYYNIHRATVVSNDDGTSTVTTTNVLPSKYDFGGSSPGWSLGQQGFTFLKDGRLVATYTKDGTTRLVVADVMKDNSNQSDGEGLPASAIEEYGSCLKKGSSLPMQFGGVIANKKNVLYFLGGSPSTPTSVYEWNLSKPDEPARVLACTSTLTFPDNVISIPRQVEFPTGSDDSASCKTSAARTAFGYYYPPCNGDYTCTTDKAPPLLVKAHGGPTACTGTTFNAGIQYWTSRGFGILDVDYGGSTGYGREYRRRLRNSWGIVDVNDVCAGAQFLASQGLADPDRLCIDGGSAGGFTTLAALTYKDVFRAGCSKYGIGDLSALAGDTHKFESRYLDGLVGSYPEDEKIYLERSPIQSVEKLSCPILLLQGDQDKIVPPNQAEMMHTALLEKGIPTCLKIYEGEQHGFRKSENIEDSLDRELAFFGKVFGIDVHDAIELQIDNL